MNRLRSCLTLSFGFINYKEVTIEYNRKLTQ